MSSDVILQRTTWLENPLTLVARKVYALQMVRFDVFLYVADHPFFSTKLTDGGSLAFVGEKVFTFDHEGFQFSLQFIQTIIGTI